MTKQDVANRYFTKLYELTAECLDDMPETIARWHTKENISSAIWAEVSESTALKLRLTWAEASRNEFCWCAGKPMLYGFRNHDTSDKAIDILFENEPELKALPDDAKKVEDYSFDDALTAYRIALFTSYADTFDDLKKVIKDIHLSSGFKDLTGVALTWKEEEAISKSWDKLDEEDTMHAGRLRLKGCAHVDLIFKEVFKEISMAWVNTHIGPCKQAAEDLM